VSHHLSRRAAASLTVAMAVTVAACASGASKSSAGAPSVARDTSTNVNGEGKSMEEMFAGKFPGVTVSRADGGGLSIRVHGGANTFYGGSEPLILVDEVPAPAISGGVVFLNPTDIAKIEVLRNPADLALYGVRASNGVIKITTKKPGKR
jgi:TonB-dependent SusC/RagA subfamily outer membrane receptor